MIIADTVDKINAQLATTDLFGKSWGLCELIVDSEGLTIPAFYKGNGEYEREVINFDKYIGTSYIRRNGKTTFTEPVEENRLVDCNSSAQMEIPLKIVCIVPKKELPQDNEFADDFVANKIASVLNGVDDFIADSNLSIILIQDYETDNQVILSEEFAGIKITDIHYKYAYLSLQLIARITVDNSCLEPECNPCYS